MRDLIGLLLIFSVALASNPEADGIVVTLKKIAGPVGLDSYEVNMTNPTKVRQHGGYAVLDIIPASKTVGSAYDVRHPDTDNTCGQYTAWQPIPIGISPGTTLLINLIAVG